MKSLSHIKRKSVQNTAFICWYHVFDVDERILATSLLKNFQGLLNEIANVLLLPLAIVDVISEVGILILVNVENG